MIWQGKVNARIIEGDICKYGTTQEDILDAWR